MSKACTRLQRVTNSWDSIEIALESSETPGLLEGFSMSVILARVARRLVRVTNVVSFTNVSHAGGVVSLAGEGVATWTGEGGGGRSRDDQ